MTVPQTQPGEPRSLVDVHAVMSALQELIHADFVLELIPHASVHALEATVDAGPAVVMVQTRPGALTVIRPRSYVTWELQTWTTPSDINDESTALLALHALAATEKPHYTSLIAGGPPKELTRAILDGIRDHLDQRNRDRFTALAPDATLTSYGGAIPFQAEGTWGPHAFYFRYRGGTATLRVGTSADSIVSDPLWQASTSYGDSMNGFLLFTEFLDLFATLSQQLERSPFLYWFSPSNPDSGLPKVFTRALDVTEAVAWLNAHILNAELNSTDYRDVPDTLDDRAWPQLPPFIIVRN
jgi:hypothetical protein